jgi:hypothetical protein
MAKKRRSKTLEKVARSIKDSDEFVEHIFGIARGFAAHHELDAGVGARGVRVSLRQFNRHAAALAEWLELGASQGSPEHEALNALSRGFQAARAPFGDVAAIGAWLNNAAQASERVERELQGKKLSNAPRFAAEALRATFEHHQLKVTLQAADPPGAAVRLLCAIAKDGGDADLSPVAARDWLRSSRAGQ